MAAIQTTKLTKTYKDLIAVDELDLSIEEGELFALLGVNGAGKTTTVKMLSTLVRPTAGEATVFGFALGREDAKIKEIVDISMQETAVARKLTVRENIELFARLAGQSKAEIAETTKRVYDDFGLGKVANKKAAELSGGWQRKLSIALSLVTNPKLLFLDEPTLGLDVIARRELWRVIENLKGKMTIVLTTHYMEEAEALSDRIGIMKDGRLLFVGTKEELYQKTGKNDVEGAFIEVVSGGDGNA